MPGPITQFLAGDHARLDALLTQAVAAAGGVDLAAYGAFRAGLLRHIALEENQDGPRVCRTAEEALRVSAMQFDGPRERR